MKRSYLLVAVSLLAIATIGWISLPVFEDNMAALFDKAKKEEKEIKDKGAKPPNLTGEKVIKDPHGKTHITYTAGAAGGNKNGGDIVLFQFDRDKQEYLAENLTLGSQLFGGEYETWDHEIEDATANLYRYMDEDSFFYYTVEIKDKFVTTTFPFNEEEDGMYSGVNAKVSNAANISSFDGAYFFLQINVDAHRYDDADSYQGGVDWGVAMMEYDPAYEEGIMVLKFYNTFEALPNDVDLTEEIESLSQISNDEHEVDDSYFEASNVVLGSYEIDPAHPEAFHTFFFDWEESEDSEGDVFIPVGEYLAGMGYATENEAVTIVDLGVGHGYLQMIRITDNFYDSPELEPSGKHFYVQTDADLGGGGGSFDIKESLNGGDSYPLVIEHNDDLGDVETDEGLFLHKAWGMPSVLYTDFDYYDEEEEDDDPLGERLYIINGYEFIMHFTIDIGEDDDRLLNFGTGALLTAY